MERPIGSEFAAGERVHAFEYGVADFIANEGFSSQDDADLCRIRIDKEEIVLSSFLCFHIESRRRVARRWRMGSAEIEVEAGDKPIKLILLSGPVKVRFSNFDHDERIFWSRDSLPKDWEGYGIDFRMIVTKWLRRLNGEIIPLSDYYKDPFNRWLDNLGE